MLFCKYQNCQFNTNSMNNIVEHVFQTHAHDFNFSIKCSIFKCNKVFYNYENFKKHSISNHQDFESSIRNTSFFCENNECISYENFNDYYAHFLQEHFEKNTY